jgi:cytochrome c553
MRKPLSIKVNPVSILHILVILMTISILRSFGQKSDTVPVHDRTFTSEDIIRGERLFYGLVYTRDKSVSCAGCHNTHVSDTLNWNPDAVEISEKYAERSASDLSRILLNPSGPKMGQVHKDFNLTQEDILLIKAYMDELPEAGLKGSKPVLNNLLLFILSVVLFFISIIDLIITKRLKRQWLHMVILLFSGFFITRCLVVDALAIGHSPDYEPDQPVKFSHEVHAGQNGTDCTYCHSYAPYSKSAGFPAQNVCMNCHLLVRNGSRSGAFEIAKLLNSIESQKSIEWIRVHNLADHVFFSHAQHVSAGKVKCQECHGPVEENDRIRLSTELTMGWCINCHRTKSVDFHDNIFYSGYKDMAEKLRRGERDSVTVEMTGGTECMKCHY